jgi:hypothetical protein
MANALDMELSNPSAAVDRWYVTNGIVAVGPVAFELLTRGVAHGRIPPNSFVRHESWKVWRRLDDIDGLSAVTRLRTVEELGGISQSAEQRASNPQNTPAPTPSSADLEAKMVDEEGPRSTMRPVAVNPVGVLASAGDLDDALMLALSTAVAASSAHVGLLHRVRPELGSTITACAQGANAEHLLGEKLAADDPALVAADAGHTVIGEPRLGDAGRHVAGRIARCVPNPRGVAMVPLVLHGALVAMIELGRRYRPFRAREIARVEDVVEALAERIVVAGWLE